MAVNLSKGQKVDLTKSKPCKTMAVNLSKGQKVDLTKSNPGLKKIIVGLGWDETTRKGLLGKIASTRAIDCDASAILLDGNGHVIGSKANDCCVYYGHLSSRDGSIMHMGDNLTGEGDGDDEQIVVDLAKVSAEIMRIVFVVNIYEAAARHQHFGMINNSFIRIVNSDNNSELCRYDLTDDNYSGKTAMIFGELYRHNSEWKFNAIGEATNDNSIGEFIKRYQ